MDDSPWVTLSIFYFFLEARSHGIFWIIYIYIFIIVCSLNNSIRISLPLNDNSLSTTLRTQRWLPLIYTLYTHIHNYTITNIIKYTNDEKFAIVMVSSFICAICSRSSCCCQSNGESVSCRKYWLHALIIRFIVNGSGSNRRQPKL